MKHRVLVLSLLVLFAVSSGTVTFTGIIYSGSKTIAADSVRFALPGGLVMLPTPGWGGGPESRDTTVFNLDNLPTFFGLYHRINGEPAEPMFATFTQDSWYYIPVTGQPPQRFPQLKWGGAPGIEEGAGLPAFGSTLAAAPNPSTGRSVIRCELALPGELQVAVFDRHGALVRRLCESRLDAGTHRFAWDAHDESGNRVPAGVYLVRALSAGVPALHKLVLTD